MTIIPKNAVQTTKNLDPIDYEELIGLDINKPARYIGNELGVKTHDWGKKTVRWALTYPEIYEVGASNLGHIILYSILNNVPDQLCDRAYLPGVDLGKRLREKSQPLFGVETKRPLFAFDLLGFSLSYELGATNILEMLDLAQINLYSAHRDDLNLNDPNCPPLIFAGGPTATSNPEPYSAFFDFFALGDGEELLPEIGLIVSQAKKRNYNRSKLLSDLSEIPGIYIPSLFNKTETKSEYNSSKITSKNNRFIRRVATPIPYYSMGLVPNIETVHDRLTIEIRRGCTRGCRFCQPGMITRPARDVEPEAVIEAIETGMEKTGYSDFSLLSLSCSDYLSLPAVGVELRNRLSDKNVSLQLPSQRVDRFDDDIAHIIGGSRQTGLTFAPEAGTQKLRNIINKGLTNEDLTNGIRKAMESGFKRIKLYFMIGLPGETDEDILGISSTCEMLQKTCKDLGFLSLNLTISNFTPKPHTPFQWHSVSKNEFERKQNLLRTELRKLKRVKANFTDVRISAMEDFIGRGDRNLAPVIESAWKAGAGMDAWFESLDRAYEAWKSAIYNAGLHNEYRKLELGNWNDVKELTHQELTKFCSQSLPWDHIDTGIEKSWLAKDLERALKELEVPDCSFETCSSCGVCGSDFGHNKIIQPPQIPVQIPQKSPPSERNCRIRFQFSKQGSVKLLSHLDILRVLERSLRRSRLPVSYSEGFHPLPRIQIALALPLGVEAFGEWLDIDFTKTIDAEDSRKILQKELPKGLNLITSESIPVVKKSLSQNLFSALWSFDLQVVSASELCFKVWEKGIFSLINTEELIWIDKDKKGRPRRRNCRSVLHNIYIERKFDEDLSHTKVKSVRVVLEALIDPIGRSVKPIQIKHWLEEYFDQSLELKNIRRDELKLFTC